MFYILNKKKKRMKFSGKVKDLLEKLGVNEQVVIVKKNGKIVTLLDNVKDKDTVEIVQVIFGG